MNPESNQQPRERSIPITTQGGGGITTTHFPLSSSTTHPGTSDSPFSNSPGRGGNLFSQLHQFRKNQHADDMFSDRSHFPSFGYPSMSSASRNVGDFFSHGQRDEEESESESHQPRVVNIPIQVETPEGVVPLSRSNSHSPGLSQLNNKYHAAPSHGGGPTSEKIGETFTRQRPGPSPTPPPKPRFTPSYKPEPQGYTQQSYHPEAQQQQHRVHNIPVQVEKGFKSRENVSYQNDSRQNVPGSDQRDSPRPDSQQFGGTHVINIPINDDKRQQSENESQQSSQPQPAPKQPKSTGETQKGPIDPIDLIKGIKEEACRLESEVNNFDGESQKQYRFLDEMLTRCMLKLDNIDSFGRDDVRSARKNTLAYVDRVIAQLERKFNKTDSNENQQEVTQSVESNEHQSPEVNSSMEAESSEADSTQNQEPAGNDDTNEAAAVSDQTSKVENQMEVESSSDHQEKEKTPVNNQADVVIDGDEQEEGGNDEEEAIEEEEEDPSGVDGSSKDFFNCSNIQLSNENICRTTEAVIVEEMDKEEPPEEPPIKIDRSNERDDKVNIECKPMRYEQLDDGVNFVNSSEPTIELPPDEYDDNNKHQTDDELMGSIENLDTLLKSNKAPIEIGSDGSNDSGDIIVDIQPFVESPDENSLSSKDSDEIRGVSIKIEEDSSSCNIQSSSPSIVQA